jgi:hypothetical protein
MKRCKDRIRRMPVTSCFPRRALAILLLLAGSAHAAGEEVELRRLQGILNVINQEMQAGYQQYQTIAEARRNAFQLQMFRDLRTPDIQNFEAVQEEQREAMRRDRELADQMSQTLARIRELEARKQPILQRIYQLIEDISVAVPRPAPALEEPVAAPVAPAERY